jgi:Ca-activated chloride channel family protein
MRGYRLIVTAALCAVIAGCAGKAPEKIAAVPPLASIPTPPPPPPPAAYAMAPQYVVVTDPGKEKYDGKEVSPVKLTQAEPVSTFCVDVDTGAYANARRFLTQGALPPRDAVRTEEMINYFRYDYAKPKDRSQPFTVTTDIAKTPWNEGSYLMRIGLRGYDIDSAEVLRGDALMLGYSFDDIGKLAGDQDNFWRQEFLRLNALAGSLKGG